jgi:hypothetical protein
MTVTWLNRRNHRAHFNEHGQPKKAFATQVEADRWAKLLYTIGVHNLLNESYLCGLCQQWHLGNPLPEGT